MDHLSRQNPLFELPWIFFGCQEAKIRQNKTKRWSTINVKLLLGCLPIYACQLYHKRTGSQLQ
jgi:hypothetical protein